MANKVSALSALAAASLDQDNDLFYVVDVSAGTSGSKNITPTALLTNRTFTGTLTWAGTTGANIVAVPDNLADAWSVKEASNAYITIVTTNSSEAVALGKSITVAGTAVITSAASTALTVGRQGSTNPGLQVDASTSTCVTGLKITPAAAAAGVALLVTSSGTNESATLDAKGSGSITINSTATGNVVVGSRALTKLLAIGPAPTDTYSASMTIAVTSSLHVVAAVNGTSATVTYTPSAAGSAGDRLVIVTEADASGTVTATFASTFHSSGTQATTASHFSVCEFMSDGTRWLEMSRTTNLA